MLSCLQVNNHFRVFANLDRRSSTPHTVYLMSSNKSILTASVLGNKGEKHCLSTRFSSLVCSYTLFITASEIHSRSFKLLR